MKTHTAACSCRADSAWTGSESAQCQITRHCDRSLGVVVEMATHHTHTHPADRADRPCNARGRSSFHSYDAYFGTNTQAALERLLARGALGRVPRGWAHGSPLWEPERFPTAA